MSIGYKKQSAASVPLPAVGEMNTFIDSADDKLKRKDSAGVVTIVESISGSVIAADVDFTPAGGLISTNVQDALEELDTEKANTSHTQTASTITDFSTEVDARITLQKGAASGLATLDGSGKIPSSQLTVDAMEFKGTWSAASNTPTLVDGTGNRGDFYKVSASGTQDLGSGPIVFEVGFSVVYTGTVWSAIGTSDSVNSVNGFTGTVVLTKADLGLSNVDNTSDVNKPVSTAQGAADAAVQAFSIQRSNHTGTQAAATITGLAAVATSGLKADVGLSNVDNTSDLSKPISTAQAAVNSAKADKAGDTFTGPVVIKGTNTGDGLTNFEAQTSAPSTPTTGYSQYADSNDRIAFKNVNGHIVRLDGTGNSANRTYTFPDQNITFMGDPMTTIGDLIVRDGSNVTSRLPIGAEDSILRVVSGEPTWEPENLTQDFGDASDGNLTVSGALTLNQIPYYDTLAVAAGAVINTNGYPIYCRTLDLSNAPAGSIVRNGNAGATVAANAGGAGGAALTAVILGGAGVGSAGAAGQTNNGAASAAASNNTVSNGGSGGSSGASGAGGTGALAAAGAGGGSSGFTRLGRFEYQFLRGASVITGGVGGDGGNSGGGDGANSSRGAGGGGGGAGVIAIYAANIITSGSTASDVIQAIGGAGGGGGVPPAGNVGGSGGAGGGGGGFVYMAYVTKTGPVVSGLINCSGGNGANGGNAIGTGIGGNGGNGGNGGHIQLYNVTTGSGMSVTGSSGASGTVGSGITGGVGGNGGACTLSL